MEVTSRKLSAGNFAALLTRSNGTMVRLGSAAFARPGAQLPGSFAFTVDGISDAAAVHIGYTGAAGLVVTKDGGLKSWNSGSYFFDVRAPLSNISSAAMLPPAKVVDIHIEDGPMYMLSADGTVWSAPGGTSSVSSVTGLLDPPFAIVNSLSGVAALSQSPSRFAAAIKSDGTVWRLNAVTTPIGASSSSTVVTVAQVPGLSNIKSVSCGSDREDMHCLALDKQGGIWSWGLNRDGQLGDGTLLNRSVPARISVLGVDGRPVAITKVIAGGLGNSYAISESGSLYSWGAEAISGRALVNIFKRTSPTLVPGLIDVRDFSFYSVLGFGAVALLGDGSVWVWGSGWDIDPTTVSPIPIRVPNVNLN